MSVLYILFQWIPVNMIVYRILVVPRHASWQRVFCSRPLCEPLIASTALSHVLYARGSQDRMAEWVGVGLLHQETLTGLKQSAVAYCRRLSPHSVLPFGRDHLGILNLNVNVIQHFSIIIVYRQGSTTKASQQEVSASTVLDKKHLNQTLRYALE